MSLTGNYYLKAHETNCIEFNINTVTNINNYSKSNCISLLFLQSKKIKYLGIDANLKWQNHIISTAVKIRLLLFKFKTSLYKTPSMYLYGWYKELRYCI